MAAHPPDLSNTDPLGWDMSVVSSMGEDASSLARGQLPGLQITETSQGWSSPTERLGDPTRHPLCRSQQPCPCPSSLPLTPLSAGHRQTQEMLEDTRFMSEQRGAGSPWLLAHYESPPPGHLTFPLTRTNGAWEFHLSFQICYMRGPTTEHVTICSSTRKQTHVFTIAHLTVA